MSGGTVAVIIIALITLLIVGLLVAAIAFVFKYGLVMIPALIVAKIFGESRNKKRK